MAQPKHPFSGRSRQARLENRNRDGAPGTGPLGSGEWKAWAEVIAEWILTEVTVLIGAMVLSHVDQKPESPRHCK